tara:strand:- start:2323 stop:2910 length:588 start_codon:yes stop_codon:yes gene_type:complete
LKVGITQRVIYKNGVPKDSLDIGWDTFLKKCGIEYELISNKEKNISRNYLKQFKGIIFTGGNSLISCNGDSKERDKAEKKIYTLAINMQIPLIGVCRGMQLIQEMHGIKLFKIFGHVKKKQKLIINNRTTITNSYHNFGTKKNVKELTVFAKSFDGITKGILSKKKRIIGIMWHPERNNPLKPYDINLFRKIFFK